MSSTIVDMPKVTQLCDSGWRVEMFKNDMGTYTASAWHPDAKARQRTARALKKNWDENAVVDFEYDRESDWDGDKLVTDDFTPEQALTRIAYKVFGEIL